MTSPIRDIHEEDVSRVETPPAPAQDSDSRSIQTWVFYCMLGGIQVSQDKFLNNANYLKANAGLQQTLLAQQKEIKFVDFSDISKDDKDAQSKMKQRQKENQDKEAERGILQNTVVAQKQNASVAMAEVNADVNNMTQKGAAISAYTKTLSEVCTAINKMNNPQ
jgi:hypothetical protein